MRKVAAAWLFVLVTGAGCSAVVDADKGDVGPPPPSPCLSGSKIQCMCLGGASGTQTCNVYERFDSCMCGTTPAGTAGTGGR